MNVALRQRRPQRGQGFVLIEALVAILIFSLGILGMVAMGGTAINAQSDARYRTDASRLVDELASEIALHVNRTDETALATSLAAYAHQSSGSNCTFSGAASTDPVVTSWLSKVTTVGAGLPGLPGASTSQQVIVAPGPTGFNRVEITVCWKDPSTVAGTAMRRHTLVTYVN